MYKNPIETPVSGLELKDWIWYNSHNDTVYTKMAKCMNYCFNLDNEKQYRIHFADGVPQVKEIDQNDISCNN